MKTGSYGEELAAEYMEERGMEILARNFFSSFGEIDIIAREGDILVFTEVKTRKDRTYGHALDAVTPSKMEKIIKTANYYILAKDMEDYQPRFDVCGIYLEPLEITYIKNAFPE